MIFMLNLSNLFVFENPDFVSFVLGFIVFVVVFIILANRFERSTAAVISLICGALSGFYLYREAYLQGNQYVFTIFFGLLVLVIILKIIWSFVIGPRI